MRRKPNPLQRRRTLCDSAIRLLAEGGVKSATHLKVDRKAGVPDGTTSFYFRTSSALLRGVAERIAELDLKDLTAATRDHGEPGALSGLSRLVARSLTGVRLTRTKARNELALQAARDPELAAAMRSYSDDFSGLIRNAVARFQPDGVTPDAGLVSEQVYAVEMFIGGVMLARASGDRRTPSAEHLDELISGMVAGVARQYRGTNHAFSL